MLCSKSRCLIDSLLIVYSLIELDCKYTDPKKKNLLFFHSYCPIKQLDISPSEFIVLISSDRKNSTLTFYRHKLNLIILVGWFCVSGKIKGAYTTVCHATVHPSLCHGSTRYRTTNHNGRQCKTYQNIVKWNR